MWPHEINALYRWYFTLPATVVILGTVVTVVRARSAYLESQSRAEGKPRFRFDENDVAVLSPFFWIFGWAVIKTLAWFVGGFSTEGEITLFYVFYGLTCVCMVTCLCIVFFYRHSMAALDLPDRTFFGVRQRVSAFYRRHATRWYFILPLAAAAFAIVAVENSLDLAELYKWYYLGPSALFFFVFLALHTLGAIDFYADEHADYHRRRAVAMAKLLTLVCLLLVVWIPGFNLWRPDAGRFSLYVAKIFYGAAIWTLCTVLSTWMATLVLAAIYGLPWIKLRKLSNQLAWAAPDQKGTVCYRIRKLGSEASLQTLVHTLHDTKMHVAARLAAARELGEVDWQPQSVQDEVWLAIAAHDWHRAEVPDDGVPVLLHVLDASLRSPFILLNRTFLSLTVIPIIQVLGRLADVRAVESLTNAVKLSEAWALDGLRVPVSQKWEDSELLTDICRTRCEAAKALAAIGEAAQSCVPRLREILAQKGLPAEVAQAIVSALTVIQPA